MMMNITIFEIVRSFTVDNLNLYKIILLYSNEINDTTTFIDYVCDEKIIFR